MNQKPNIDERLKALVHSLKRQAEEHKETEKEIDELGEYVSSVKRIVLDHEALPPRAT
jgi:hypothetical protein